MDATRVRADPHRISSRGLPGAYACALVDLGGETVDYAGVGESVRREGRRRAHANRPERPRGVRRARASALGRAPRRKRSFVARRLPEGYALVVMLRRRAGFTASARAYAACERALVGRGRVGPRGPRTGLVSDRRRGRPPRTSGSRSATAGVAVEVFGAVMGLAAQRAGFSRPNRDGKRAHASCARPAIPGTRTRTSAALDAPLRKARNVTRPPRARRNATLCMWATRENPERFGWMRQKRT